MQSIAIMKILLVAILLALASVSPAHAILRPRFPHHTWPPQNRDGFPREQSHQVD
jgi:hypothetical protein